MISNVGFGILHVFTIGILMIMIAIVDFANGVLLGIRWVFGKKWISIGLIALYIVGFVLIASYIVGFVPQSAMGVTLPVVRVTSNGNDGQHGYTAGESHTYATDASYIVVGVGPSAWRYDGVFRFENMNLPAHAQIVSAYIRVYVCTTSPGEQENPLYTTIKLENSDSAIAVTTDNGWHSRPVTQGTAWTVNGDWTTYQWYSTGDFYADLQTVVSRPGWVYGNDINVFILASNPYYNYHYKTICAFDYGDETYSAQLYVSYVTSIATPTPTPTIGPTPIGGPEKIGVFEGWPKSSVLIVVMAGFVVLAVALVHFHVPGFAIVLIETVAAAALFSSQFAATWIVLVGVLTVGVVVVLIFFIKGRSASNE